MSSSVPATALSRRKKRFIDLFAESGQAVESVEKAGYSPRRSAEIAKEFLKDPAILAAVEQRTRMASITRPEALMRLTEIGRGSMQSFLEVVSTPAGEQVRINLTSEEAQQNLHLIKSVSQQCYTMQTADGPVEVVETGLELHCAMTAIDHILHLLGEYPAQKYDYTTNGQPINTVLDIGRVARQLGIADEHVAGFVTAVNAAVQALPSESNHDTPGTATPAAAAA
ncbi:terminase small subunit [Hymenobacter sp. NST-14]|uniref:terminase small subunit n=1 Tax=Hymenobacter piscis TaxID=2839984 RepID=UPI001C026EBB|nr:terminase small subunit [Hymenobacter piscis]MBT9395333.1 terminase small subunit [Hymenobacter piscis]